MVEYRIREVRQGNHIWYEVDRKVWFFWFNLANSWNDYEYGGNYWAFGSVEQALAAIDDRANRRWRRLMMRPKINKVVRTIRA